MNSLKVKSIAVMTTAFMAMAAVDASSFDESDSPRSPASPKLVSSYFREGVGHLPFDGLMYGAEAANLAGRTMAYRQSVNEIFNGSSGESWPELRQLLNGAFFRLEKLLGDTPLEKHREFWMIRRSFGDLAVDLTRAGERGGAARNHADALDRWVAARYELHKPRVPSKGN